MLLLHRCALRKFHLTDSQTTHDQITRGPHVSDQIAFCQFHSFLVEVQTNAGYIHTTHAWRLGLPAPPVTRNNHEKPSGVDNKIFTMYEGRLQLCILIQ